MIDKAIVAFWKEQAISKQFMIRNTTSGVVIGIYQGCDQREAYLVMLSDAGEEEPGKDVDIPADIDLSDVTERVAELILDVRRGWIDYVKVDHPHLVTMAITVSPMALLSQDGNCFGEIVSTEDAFRMGVGMAVDFMAEI
ncbi:MAG TPA: hypothetical protein DD435_09030 [Cyanobacteria bacterium UBA8530]|nr:hypothetical protein [Cyanobacteria bacterium UBA8530]